MNTIEQFDVLVPGGDKAGKTLAMDQARAGHRVALVEAGMIGGSCINVACIPSKALIRSAEIARIAARSEASGIATEELRPDMAHIAARTAEVVGEMVALNRKAFDVSGFELFPGWGRFVEPRVVKVVQARGTRRRVADRI